MDLTQPCSLQRASPLVQLPLRDAEALHHPKAQGKPLYVDGKGFISLRGGAEASKPGHSSSSPTPRLCRSFTSLPELQLHRDQQRHGTGTIFRPLLTMTSGKRSRIEPSACAAGTVGTRTPLRPGGATTTAGSWQQRFPHPKEALRHPHVTQGTQRGATNKSL